jgi:hypothetical protein
VSVIRRPPATSHHQPPAQIMVARTCEVEFLPLHVERHAASDATRPGMEATHGKRALQTPDHVVEQLQRIIDHPVGGRKKGGVSTSWRSRPTTHTTTHHTHGHTPHTHTHTNGYVPSWR